MTEQTARERLIDKLADQMDRDNATAFVDEVIAEAVEAVNVRLREHFQMPDLDDWAATGEHGARATNWAKPAPKV